MKKMTWTKASFEVAFVVDGDHAIAFYIQKKPGSRSTYMVTALEVAKPASEDDVGMAHELLDHHAHEVVGDKTYDSLADAKAAANVRGDEWLAARAATRRPVLDPCPCGDIVQ